jgi:hypothetical protein
VVPLTPTALGADAEFGELKMKAEFLGKAAAFFARRARDSHIGDA